MTNDLVLLLLPAALPVLCNLWTCFRLRAEWPTSSNDGGRYRPPPRFALADHGAATLMRFATPH